ncbi:hypothetical protein CH063_14540 [Colletotrichum higginsianum]|uniref:Uncharacterized protein n=1 Tax=Colletotrichum higginsianum (strain IMI 349063) TaxID=759273 RepID=H1VYZ8_COLHI|nr:hypothetical protein CH063_14540 [Colletotrichum higginsianum]
MDAQSDIRRPSVSFADRSSTGESSEATPVASIHSNPVATQLPNPSAAATPSCSSSWSANSDRQLGHGASPDPTDRVFPIRSVVSVDRTGRTSGEHDYFPRVPDHIRRLTGQIRSQS